MEQKPIRVLERTSAADLWRRTLSQVPGVFGRIIYLASLRNPNTGRYEHHGLAQTYGEDEANHTLAASHEFAFGQWLSFSVQAQKADLDLYLSGLTTGKKTLVETWLRLAPYRNLIPATASAGERRLYLADMTTLLEVLRIEAGVSAIDPDS
ncbi:MAG: hypothetical protein U0Q16_01760 [Bryobacteraceae bacterium]